MQQQSQNDVDYNKLSEDESFDCNPQKVLRTVNEMYELKLKIYEKAKKNIGEAKIKDKLYYDKKHPDPKVHVYKDCIL